MFATITDKLLSTALPPVTISPKIYPYIWVALTVSVGVLVAWLPLVEAALLVGGAVFLPLVLINPAISLYGLIPIIPVSGLLAVSAAGVKVGLMEVVLALTLAAGLLKILAHNRLAGHPLKLKLGPLALPFLIFLGAATLSWVNALSIGASLVETAKWVEMFLLYLFIINLVPRGHIKWLVAILITSGLGQAVLGLYQFIFKVGPEGFLLFDGRFLRAYGTFAQPNPYGGYLGLILPLVLSLTIWAIGQKLPQSQITFDPEKQLGQKFADISARLVTFTLLGLPLALLLAALFASQSRGAWLGFALAGTVTVVVRSKKVAIGLALLILAGASVALISSFNISPLQPAATESESAYGVVTQRLADAVAILTISDVANTPVTDANFATVERLAHWQAAREMWRDNPWLGVGFGNYAAIYPAYAVDRWLDPLGHAHNYLLNLGAETGLVGTTAYLIFWIFTFGLLWVVVQRSQGFYRAVAAGAVGVIVHLHIHNLVDNLYVQGMYLHVAIILGLVSIIYRYQQSNQTAT